MNPPRSALDTLFFILFWVGLLAIAFVAGAATMHFRLHAAYPLIEAFEGGAAWVREEKKQAKNQKKVITPAQAAKRRISAINKSTVTWDPKTAFNGYTLVTLRGSTGAYLLDMNGKIVYQWQMPFDTAFPERGKQDSGKMKSFRNAKLFSNGDLIAVYGAFDNTPYGRGIAKMDKKANLLWSYFAYSHHTFYIAKDTGNIYALTQNIVTRPISKLDFLQYPILCDEIAILSPNGKELERISLLEALRDSPYANLLARRTEKRADVWDVGHTNSVVKLESEIEAKFPMFKPNSIMVSMRNYNTIAVIDPASKKVVWAINHLTSRQHDASFLPNGNILTFDNLGQSKKKPFLSRIIEIDPATKKIVYTYGSKPEEYFISRTNGMVEHLPNDNLLITESNAGRVFEVTRDGRKAWELKLPKGEMIFSAYRYSADELPFLKQP